MSETWDLYEARAITLWQPWASLVALGLKAVETRGRPTSWRGPLVIHAARRWDRDQVEIWVELGIRLADLVGADDPRVVEFRAAEPPRNAALAVTRVVATHFAAAFARSLPEREVILGDYSSDRRAWVLGEVYRLRHRVPCRGAQGLWMLPRRVLHLVARQMGASA